MTTLYTVETVAVNLGLSKSCVYKLTEKGVLQSYKIGTSRRFSDAHCPAHAELAEIKRSL